MITIRSTAYTDEDKRELLDILSEAENNVHQRYCNGNICTTCGVRRLCDDVRRIREHAEKLTQK